MTSLTSTLDMVAFILINAEAFIKPDLSKNAVCGNPPNLVGLIRVPL